MSSEEHRWRKKEVEPKMEERGRAEDGGGEGVEKTPRSRCRRVEVEE